MKIVQIFKTDVQDQLAAGQIIFFLQQTFSHCRINFDLDDCDRILRVENHEGEIEASEIQLLIARCGHHCEPLQD
jgi:hypothetical protein